MQVFNTRYPCDCHQFSIHYLFILMSYTGFPDKLVVHSITTNRKQASRVFIVDWERELRTGSHDDEMPEVE